MSKILIIDDSPTVVEMARAVLEDNHYEVIDAGDGETGLKKARNENPDLIILDLMLPKIDGHKVCRMLKFDDKYKRIPIIMFTSKSSEEDKKIGKEVGANDYITKDFDSAQLVELVNKYLKK
jgi:DNA-binding response OmpR family regulator